MTSDLSAGADAGPVRSTERILALDVVRGLAIFGVLVAYCAWNLGTAPEETYSRLDRILDVGLTFLVDNKFYTLLAFLFGLGFALQLGRGSAAEADKVRLYRRRLIVLAVFGFLHAVLLRNGDILLPYAITGFFMIPFRRASDRVVLAAVLVCFFWPSIAEWAWQRWIGPLPERPQTDSGSYLADNFAWVRYWYATAPLSWPFNLSLFLLGLLAGRHAFVGRMTSDPRLCRRMAVAGILAALLFFAARLWLGGVTPAPAWGGVAGRLLFTFHAWSLAMAYAALLVLALRTGAGGRALRPLAAIGRMALTNYLLPAILIVPLCLWLGWFDRFTPSSALLLALVVFALQVPFSLWWLRRFEFGPAEWLWRRLTYGKAAERRAAAEAPL